jgi:hypothetical protein
MFNNICIDSLTTLPCGTGVYGDIAGWVTNPVTAAQSMNNLWLVVCQLNDCLSATPAKPCVTIPPVSVSIASITTTGATITWVAPVTTGSEAPIGYKIEIFNEALTMPPLLSVTVGPTPLSYTAVSPSFVAGIRYVVRVSAIYDCGTSEYVQTIGVLISPAYAAKVYYGVTGKAGTVRNCTDPIGPTRTPFTPQEKTLKVDLRDASGALLVNTGTTINVIVRIEYIGCSTAPVVETDITIPILTGQQFGTYEYEESALAYCAEEGCIGVTRNVICLVAVQLAGGGPLPSTIGLDASLTSLGTC